jgi:hypothetical protein
MDWRHRTHTIRSQVAVTVNRGICGAANLVVIARDRRDFDLKEARVAKTTFWLPGRKPPVDLRMGAGSRNTSFAISVVAGKCIQWLLTMVRYD